MPEKQPEKQGSTNRVRGNKPFTKGDPRINRTRPGPGRSPMWWRELLATYEQGAVETIGKMATSGRRTWLRLRAAQTVIEHLYGKPTQPFKHVPAIDVSKLSTDELRTLDALLSRVVVADAWCAQGR